MYQKDKWKTIKVKWNKTWNLWENRQNKIDKFGLLNKESSMLNS